MTQPNPSPVTLGEDHGARRRLKVFSGCFDGTTETIVAATSQAKAALAFNVSLRMVQTYGHETGNDVDIQVAMSKPGTVFSAPINSSGAEFVEGLHRYHRGQPWPPSTSAKQTAGKPLGTTQNLPPETPDPRSGESSKLKITHEVSGLDGEVRDLKP